MDTITYPLHDMSLGTAAPDLGFLCAVPTLTAPALLTIGFDYTAPHAANGVPGDEPDQVEALDIMRIESEQPLHFADRDEGVLVTLLAGPGRDLRGYFTDSGLVDIELSVLATRRGRPGAARLETHLAQQP